MAQRRWHGTVRGNSGLLTVRQPGGEILHQPVPSHEQLAFGCGSCLARPEALPSPGSGPQKGSCGAHRPGTHLLVERARGGAGGGNNVPLETCTNSSTGCLQVHLCKRLLPAPYLNISVTSPLASATRTGKPMQAGTKYRRAGCKRKQAVRQCWAGYLLRATHPFLGMTGTATAQVHRASQCLGLNLGS